METGHDGFGVDAADIAERDKDGFGLGARSSFINCSGTGLTVLAECFLARVDDIIACLQNNGPVFILELGFFGLVEWQQSATTTTRPQ